MIDFIRVKLINRLIIIHQLKSKDKYDLKGKYNYKTKKGEYPISSKTENLFIKITEKSAILENSLHKYFNIIKGKGNQNFNDFNFCDIQTALDILEKDNKYSLTDTSLTNLEFGFNIELDICPTKFLKNHVLMFDFKPPCYNPKNNPKMKINKFTYIEYEFKIYNKSLHYKSQNTFKGVLENKHILRIEVKYKSKKQLNKLGVFNLSDLKKAQVYNALIKDFFIKFDKLLI